MENSISSRPSAAPTAASDRLLAYVAAGGAFLVDRSVWHQRWILVVPLGVVALTALASYGNQRFRASAEPGTLVLAAIGLVAMADRLRRQPAQAPTGSS